ncbi:MAG: energy transducer TonB [Gammaproteobacteria bacterium]
MTLARVGGAALLAALTTFIIFFLMQRLVASGESAFTDEVTGRIVDFVRVKQPEQVEERDRKPDKPPPPEAEPPAPDIQPQLSNPGAAGAGPSLMQVAPPDMGADVSLDPGIGAGAGEGDYLPIVKVAPIYPSRAQARGIEGWVLVEFTVTSAGTTRDPVVVEAEPAGYFEEAAMQAVLKFRYKPRVVNGNPVEVAGVRNLIRFELER